ncbi:MAG: prepilin-type N-terminal cleavage/methylation domain-containing protein [Patescibacteria group bacterium]|nr:prepilin-type N-terminal cleavage/methylation domain-containing protein [Patescibacteria group bacterium]
MTKKSIRNKQSGFSLVEVIISISLVTVVILAFNQLALFAFNNWKNAEYRTVAYNLVQSTIEQLHNVRDINVNSADDVWTNVMTTASPGYTIASIGGKSYYTYVTVSSVPVTLSGADLPDSKRKVVVTVKWLEASVLKSLSSTTYLTDWKGKY